MTKAFIPRDPERIAAAVEAYRQGASTVEAAPIAGMAPTTFGRYLLSIGEPLREPLCNRGHVHYDPDTLARAVKAYESGRSAADVGQNILKVSGEITLVVLRAAGVQIRKRGGGEKGDVDALTPEVVRAAHERYTEGSASR
jgi:hypothetical protein